MPDSGARTAVFFLSHRTDAEVTRRFRTLREQMPPGHACTLVLHKQPDAAAPRDAEDLLPLTTEAVQAQPFARRLHASGGRVVPGNADQLFLAACLERPDHDYYWLVEYDVVYTGRWRDFFQHFTACAADLLGTNLRAKPDIPHWNHWAGLRRPPPFDRLGDERLLRGFFPVMRLSRRAIATLVADYARDWRGHYEAILPTILGFRGHSIEDIGGDGPFTPADRVGRFYTSSPKRKGLAPGSFVYRPKRRRPGLKRGLLWHPVKPRLRPCAVQRLIERLYRRLNPY